ncbi:arsenate reductase/protein-tyrosine-phosphatase family protein [Nocardioides sp. Root140]|uniref:arsenate reductase/protein-tyrosine-phosphatase family protein n=1 Tax=Nocardioides sp. Root140 TaxID=1736460 RepID=UPI0006F57002|nr:ArsR family transcriptional regulator [Nocardioides sp. Root140]KQY56677.1 ArsR family transcriptional regulator [Nocardioides sp. Root140]
MARATTLTPPVTVPAFLRLSGHPVRWQLLNELARGDRQVRELTASVGQQQSLTSYHLRLLRDGGLVTMRRSSADRRDTYYSLDLSACRELLGAAGGALHPGLAPPGPPPTKGGRRKPARVLFLCTGNSSRSQMAEAILQHLGGAAVDVASAGSHPKPIHPYAVRVMRKRGLDLSDKRSKHLDDYAGQRFDHVISLCDKVREVCPDFPGTPSVAHWSIADPAAEGHPAFVRTAEELETRIRFLLSALGCQPTE